MKRSTATGQYPLWQRLSEKTVYKGRLHIVEHEAVLPGGKRTTYEVEHSDGKAVAVLIKTIDNQIVLTHQFRFPLNRWIYDLPGGGSPADEDVEEGAIRECQEEVGCRPKSLFKLATFYPNPGRSDWAAHLFYCDNFDASELQLNDPSEVIEKVLVPVQKLDEMIRKQEIVDPSLLIAWHSARNLGYV